MHEYISASLMQHIYILLRANVTPYKQKCGFISLLDSNLNVNVISWD